MAERNKPEEVIPQPKDKLFLLDLDKTIIDTNYQITNRSVLDHFERLQENGWTLGLNSDTPLEPLKLWSDNLGLNGPVIAERGAVIMHRDGQIEILDESENFFRDLKIGLLRDLSEKRMAYYHGDVTQVLKENIKFPGVVEKDLMLVQAYRRCSLNFFSRRVDADGSLSIDNDLTQEHIILVHSFIEKADFDIEEDFNSDYGIYIVSPKRVNKRLGVKRLMEREQLTQVGMIGDSMADYVGSDLAVQYAVGNAKKQYKREADYVSLNEYSDGIIEILDSLV